MSIRGSLQQKRQSSLRKWSSCVGLASDAVTSVLPKNHDGLVRPTEKQDSASGFPQPAARSRHGVIEQSWHFSALSKVSIDTSTAPVGDPEETWKCFRDSKLYGLLAEPVHELGRIARECNFAVGVSDSNATLQWALHSKSFESRLEKMHFVPSARWGEADIGTNAVGLAARLCKPVTVFAAEHYVPNLHSWVCYAAPVIDPATGRVVAVIDISGAWQDAHPMAMQTVASYALDMSKALQNQGVVTSEQSYALELCGHRPGLWLNHCQLSPRLQEIVLILACHPGGLSLDQLHAHVYGDLDISISTLKSELTHLRRRVGNVLQSRPYRLQWPGRFVTDMQLIEHYALNGKIDSLVSAYLRQPLVQTRSPAVEDYCRYLHQLVISALCKSADVDALWQFMQHHGDEYEVLDCLKEHLPEGDTRHLVVDAKLSCADD